MGGDDFCAVLPRKKTGSSTMGLNNFDEMLHPVSEYVELCQLEGSVAVTVTGGVPSDYCVHVCCQRNNRRLYFIHVCSYSCNCQLEMPSKEALYTFMTNCSLLSVNDY